MYVYVYNVVKGVVWKKKFLYMIVLFDFYVNENINYVYMLLMGVDLKNVCILKYICFVWFFDLVIWY